MNVILVGNVNVGKSTVFNQLVGKKIAVTHNSCGTTVDLLCEHSKDGSYTICDTPGISNNIKEKIFNFLLSVEIILLVVDAYKGINIQEDILINLLKKNFFNKLILILNKIDKVVEHNLYDYYKTGIKDIIPISAEKSLNIDILNNVIKKRIVKKIKNEKPDFLISIVGRSNSGKSVLFNNILNISCINNNTTRDCVKGRLKYYNHIIEFIDMMSYKNKYNEIEYFCKLRRENYIKESNVILFTIDSKKGLSHSDKKYIFNFWNNAKKILLVITKFDQSVLTKTEYTEYIRKSLPNIDVPIFFTSYLYDNKKILKSIINVQKPNNIDQKSLDNILNCAINNCKPFHPRQEIKILGIKQLENLHFNIYANHPSLIKQSYKKYLANQIKYGLNLSGINIKINYKKISSLVKK